MSPNKFVPVVLQMAFFLLFAVLAGASADDRDYDAAVMWGFLAMPYAVALGIAMGRESKR